MPSVIRVIHEKDPAEEILDDIGVLAKAIQPLGVMVLLCVYERGRQKEVRTASGLIVPETANGTISEDKWQGKVCLVVALGPIAFQSDGDPNWGGVTPKVGDWVIVETSETSPFDVPSKNGQRRMRFVHDTNIRAIVSPKFFDAVC